MRIGTIACYFVLFALIRSELAFFDSILLPGSVINGWVTPFGEYAGNVSTSPFSYVIYNAENHRDTCLANITDLDATFIGVDSNDFVFYRSGDRVFSRKVELAGYTNFDPVEISIDGGVGDDEVIAYESSIDGFVKVSEKTIGMYSRKGEEIFTCSPEVSPHSPWVKNYYPRRDMTVAMIIEADGKYVYSSISDVESMSTIDLGDIDGGTVYIHSCASKDTNYLFYALNETQRVMAAKFSTGPDAVVAAMPDAFWNAIEVKNGTDSVGFICSTNGLFYGYLVSSDNRLVFYSFDKHMQATALEALSVENVSSIRARADEVPIGYLSMVVNEYSVYIYTVEQMQLFWWFAIITGLILINVAVVYLVQVGIL